VAKYQGRSPDAVTAPVGHAFPVPPDHARLTIILDLEAEPIAGVLRGEDGHSDPFAGWMELTRAIERGLRAARQAAEVGLPAQEPPAPGLDGSDGSGGESGHE
jgi:hypothetical protein